MIKRAAVEEEAEAQQRCKNGVQNEARVQRLLRAHKHVESRHISWIIVVVEVDLVNLCTDQVLQSDEDTKSKSLREDNEHHGEEQVGAVGLFDGLRLELVVYELLLADIPAWQLVRVVKAYGQIE